MSKSSSLPASVLDHALNDFTYFVGKKGKPPAIPWRWRKGPRDARLAVIVGENASGKSFLRKLLREIHRDAKIELIHLSMSGRTDRSNPMVGFVYGDENWESTGQCSVNTVVGAMKTASGRTHPTAIFWDEPDVGLSDSWAAGVGVRVREYAQSAPEHVRGIYLVTHRRVLLQELVAAKPHFVWLGNETLDWQPSETGGSCPTLDEWLQRPVVPRRDLESLGEDSVARFRALSQIIDAASKKKAAT